MSRYHASNIETPLSDALVAPMLKAVEFRLAALERAPTRRRRSLRRQLAQVKALIALTDTFNRLMQRREEILSRQAERAQRWDGRSAREELQRRLELYLGAEEEEEAEAAAQAAAQPTT